MAYPSTLTTVAVAQAKFIGALGVELDQVTVTVAPNFGPGCTRVRVGDVLWTTVPETIRGDQSWSVPHVDQEVLDGTGLVLTHWSYSIAATVKRGALEEVFRWSGWQPTSDVASIDLADIPSGVAGSSSAPQVWAVAAREAAQSAAAAQEALEAVPGAITAALREGCRSRQRPFWPPCPGPSRRGGDAPGPRSPSPCMGSRTPEQLSCTPVLSQSASAPHSHPS